MVASEELFLLIKSLNKAEKAYFKLYSSLHTRGEKNNYIRLFDAINKQKQYDENKLKEKFSGYAFIRQFSVAKNYLYNQILYATESCDTGIHSEIYTLLYRAKFLYEKGLYGQAKKIITKARQLIVENELYGVGGAILRPIEFGLANQKNDIKWLKDIQQEANKELRLLRNTNIYENLLYSIYSYDLSYGTTREKKHLDAIKKIMKSSALSDESKAKTVSAKIRFNAIHSFYEHMVGNHKQAYFYTVNIFRIFKQHPEIKQRRLGYYWANLNNACVAGLHLKQYSDIPNYLEELEALESIVKSESQKIKLFNLHKNNLLSYLNKTGQFREAESQLPEIIKQLNQYENKLDLPYKAILFGNIAIVYFGTNQYKQNIFWLNRLRNETNLTVSPDMESFLRLFYLIVHYEAGHDDILPYQIQSVYRFLRKKSQLYKFEKIVIDYLRNHFPKANSPKELISVFKKMRTEILPLAHDPYEKNAFEHFDYISWIESKIENRSFAEIVRQKADPSSSPQRVRPLADGG